MWNACRKIQSALRVSALVFAALAVALGLVGCSNRQARQARLDRALHEMNQRHYENAIRLLEEQHALDPGDTQVALYLAESHLGMAGLELLKFADEVLGDQRNQMLSRSDIVFDPDCGGDRIEKFDSTSWRCLIQRIYVRLPDPDQYHLASARTILRSAFPDPKRAGIEVNFLCTFVEWSSALSRLKFFVKELKRKDLRNLDLEQARRSFGYLVYHFKYFLRESMQGFRRAKHSYGKISRYVKTFEGMPLIRVGERELVFNEDLDLPIILDFLAMVIRDQSETMNARLAYALADVLSEALSDLDSRFMRGVGSTILNSAWRFDSVIANILEGIGHSVAANQPVRLLSAVWTNPPSILQGFDTAVAEAWENESPLPLERYAHSTQFAWRELGAITQGWESWISNTLSGEKKEQLLRWFKERATLDARLSAPPQALGSPEFSRWMSGFIDGVMEGLQAVLSDAESSPDAPQFHELERVEGLRLIERTRAWRKAHWEVRP